MKKNLLTKLGAAIFALTLSANAMAQTTLASWTFDTGYSVAGNVYTPNDETWAEIKAQWFNAGAPQFVANEAVGEAADYIVTGKTSRYWQVCTGYNNQVLRIVNDTEANNITNYSDVTQHNNYFEVSLPTKGYQNVKLEYSCAYGGNAEATLQAVISSDGGLSWMAAEEGTTASTWWTYQPNTVSLPADKDQVVVRLIFGNDLKSNWNMDYIKVTGDVKEAFVSEVVDNQTATVTFPFDKGVDGQTATFSDGSANWFKNSYVTVGDNLNMTGTQTIEGLTQTSFNAVEGKDNEPAEQNAVDFLFVLKNGLTFTPTRVAYKTTRYGTGEGMTAVSWYDNGTVTTIKKDIKPERNNQGDIHITVVDEKVSTIAAASGVCGVRINIYQLSGGYPSRQVGLGEIEIEGTVNGETQPVQQFKFTVKCDPADAGRIKVTPAGNEFDEGDEISIFVEENFGYHFQSWVNGDGRTVSEENPYTFTIVEDTDLTATFTKKNTFELHVALTDGARENLVSIEPAGTIISGKRMYEEGDQVKLNAHNNKILTFTGWENNSTDVERIITMSSDQELTAHFSAADYIVGWDFYSDQPNQERAADYRSDSENAGLLSLHNAEGTTSAWLTRGINNGAENGRWAARIWRDRSQGLYFEASFSTKGYKNIKVSSSLGCSYNTYSVNNMQYSVDGTNYTTLTTFNITGSGWFDKADIALPEDADEQERVYIRWMPDRDSELVGAATDYDGLAITDIFVTAEAGALADEQATLVASNPEPGATGVSRNGSIILNFDNKVKAGEGKAALVLDGSPVEEIEPIVSGKSAIFKYSGLGYNTEYTFTMPQGVLTSRSGNAVAATTITFTTMERQQPEARLYDAVVAQDGSGDYTKLQDAINAAPAGRAKPWLIFVKNGQYNEHIDIPASKPYLHIIGQQRDNTVVLDDRLCGGDNAYSVDPGATVVVKGTNTFFENITLENSYGHEKQAGPQALALNTQADRVALNNVALLSYQDTWITTSTSNNRHYIKNSLIEGAVDFIYNSGNVYLDGDTLEINRPSGGYIVAPSHGADVKWGYVFQNNIIRAHPGVNVTDVWLGRPWHNQPKTVYINTQTFVNIPAKGWYNTMGGLPALWAEYNTVDADGNPVDLSQRETYYYYTDSNTGEKHEVFDVKNTLTAEEAAEYTLKNVMGGDDNWQPELLCEACDAPKVTFADGKLSWDAVPYAICYVVTKNNDVVAFTTDCEYTADSATDFKVQAVNEFGGLSQYGTVATTVSITDVNQSTGQQSSYYSLDGKRLQAARHGITLERQSDGTIRKVVMK